MEITAVPTITAVLGVAPHQNHLATIGMVLFQVTPAVVCMAVRLIGELTEGATVPQGGAVEVVDMIRVEATWEEGVGQVPARHTWEPSLVLVASDLLFHPVVPEGTRLAGPHLPEVSLLWLVEGMVQGAELRKTSARGPAQEVHRVGGPLLVTDILNTLGGLRIHSLI